MAKSIEPKVQDWFATSMHDNKTQYNKEQDSLTVEIGKALAEATSKSGGTGGNRPDFSMMVKSGMNHIPVMIEAKGTKNKLLKLTKDESIDLGKAVTSFAVNGAVHYSNIVVNDINVPYVSCIAVGINGFDDKLASNYEVGIYYIAKENMNLPKYIGDDLSLLYEKNWDILFQKIAESKLTDADREKLAQQNESVVTDLFKTLNQKMHDEWEIQHKDRVELIAGMVMAGLGSETVGALEVTDLKGDKGAKNNDGRLFIDKVEDFLYDKNIPAEKIRLISNSLQRVFLNLNLQVPVNGVSTLRKVYTYINAELLPYLRNGRDIGVDFMGRFFNCLTDWAGVADDAANDCVLTPRYVTEMMAKLCRVDRNSYVWDYATGTAGFLVSSMKLMIADAENISDINEREKIKMEIRAKQLLGIEKRPEMYLLGVLNMILMGDGSTNILQADSLQYDGTYQQGCMKGQKFPANVFLLNPPYSADGKGFIFVKKALDKMDSGYAAVLIQENAGSGNGLPYTEQILKSNTLIASIHMSDIFKGKAGVQTAVYLFEVGKAHNKNTEVCFIDMTEDGYTRQNRKKASSTVNLRNTDHAVERYQEVIDIIVNHKRDSKCEYYKEGDTVFWDKISLSGDDWMFSQHKVVDMTPTEADFQREIGDYLAWKVSAVLKNEV
ncbi:HsdM family class I SAM-dependent methyltransferase [Clostridium massiliodielmoense]|uniref:HsdM family class I SAM-dependent methyltransferase n=1 Tax=Clostridium massiliodielmoense TaxID=1776385 RepID=UPI000A26DE59|nr:N-6 DNA methylase [Clostridium massiliodielmoense]